MVWDDIIIEYTNDGCERTDAVARRNDMSEMAKKAEYDRQGQAHIEIKHTLSFGTSTSRFKVRRVSTRFILLSRVTRR